MSKNSPLLILGVDTSRTPPSHITPSLTKVSKLMRKRRTADDDDGTMTAFQLRKLSFWLGGAMRDAALAGVSGLRFVLTHPSALQPAGNAGGMIPSKFSLSTIPPHGVAVG